MMKVKNCNWPELSSYCGCCKLSTGIYVRSGLAVTLLSGLSYVVVSNIIRLLKLRDEFHSYTNQTILVDYLDITVLPANYESMIIFFKTVICFHIFWIAFRVFYIFKTLILCYAVYKSKVAAVKILLYISIPCSIFDAILSILGFFLFRHVLKIVLLIFYLSEGYNILAIYSEYKRISGTSRIIRKEDIGEPNIDSVCQRRVTTHPEYISCQRPHCQSCTCFVTISSGHAEASIHVPRYDSIFGNVSEINLQNDVTYRSNDKTERINENLILINPNEASGERPDHLELNAEKKTDIANTPVIYDEDQLQTSGSPVIENR